MTSQFDGYESDTLFNSMQEGGQGVFSLMVDLKNVVDLGGSRAPKNALEPSAVKRPATHVAGADGAPAGVRVGQELRIELSERSVSPEAGDVTVVWSNGYVGSEYHVQPEDLGTTLTATATFAGQHMKPLEVTIECGPVVMAPAPEFDTSLISIVGEETSGEGDLPSNFIKEFAPVHMLVDSMAFSSPVDSIDVAWFVDGQEMSREQGITARVLTSSLELELIERSDSAKSTDRTKQSAPKIPPFLAQVLFGEKKADTVGGITTVDFTNSDEAGGHTPQDLAAFLEFASANVGSGMPLESELDALVDLATASSTTSDAENAGIANDAAAEAAEADASDKSGAGVTEGAVAHAATDPFFAAQFTPAQGTAGAVLSVEITAHTAGAHSLTKRINAGWIGQGTAFALKDDVSISVSDPRVGETAWVKAKRRHFTPAPQALGYQWTLNGVPIEGATKSTLKVTRKMRGRELAVLVEASGPRAMTSTVEVLLGHVGVGDAPEYLGEPLAIKGKPVVGSTLRIAHLEPDFVIPKPDSIDIQWMRGSRPISGARSLKYSVDFGDVDEKIWARVVLRRVGHATAVITTDSVRIHAA